MAQRGGVWWIDCAIIPEYKKLEGGKKKNRQKMLIVTMPQAELLPHLSWIQTLWHKPTVYCKRLDFTAQNSWVFLNINPRFKSTWPCSSTSSLYCTDSRRALSSFILCRRAETLYDFISRDHHWMSREHLEPCHYNILYTNLSQITFISGKWLRREKWWGREAEAASPVPPFTRIQFTEAMRDMTYNVS